VILFSRSFSELGLKNLFTFQRAFLLARVSSLLPEFLSMTQPRKNFNQYRKFLEPKIEQGRGITKIGPWLFARDSASPKKTGGTPRLPWVRHGAPDLAKVIRALFFWLRFLDWYHPIAWKNKKPFTAAMSRPSFNATRPGAFGGGVGL